MARTIGETLVDLDSMEAAIARMHRVIYAKAYF